ncbi:MAG: hypothetical protein COA84_13125 [Robiginitomaculum sp.]|nr:MAG: hypothetical protein COA84_13125 [Robiginitomaculum sp.]
MHYYKTEETVKLSNGKVANVVQSFPDTGDAIAPAQHMALMVADIAGFQNKFNEDGYFVMSTEPGTPVFLTFHSTFSGARQRPKLRSVQVV